jgi:pyruvate/2-oxoglutarate dehydrogenase complex dihydrolipoamide dehydrogenase (E3) component
MKIVVDADTREILGAAILGVGGDEAMLTLSRVTFSGQRRQKMSGSQQTQ